MTFLTILLSLIFSLPNDSIKTQTDSIHQKEIKEVTVYSIASNKIGLPYIAVDKTEFEKQDFRTPADALQTQTGIALSRDGSWGTSVNVRGMGEQRLMLMVDGDRLQSATDVAGVLSTVSLNQLEKIEVIKGAGSVLFGSGAMGGVVNFVLERPAFSDILTVNGNVQTGISTVNNITASTAKVNFTNKNWYVSANGSYRKAGNTMTPKGVLPNSQFNDASWSLKGGMRYGDNQELVVGYNEFYGWDIGIPGNDAFKLPIPNVNATVRYLGVKRRQLNGEYIFTDISDMLTKLSIKAYTQNISRDVENTFNPNAVSKKIILPSSINSTSGVKATAELYFNDYNTMTVGVESWLRKSETFRLNITETPNDTLVIAEQPSPLAKVLNVGAFALYKKVIDPKYFNINFGLRLDYFQTSNDTLFKELYRYKIDNAIRTNDLSQRVSRILPSQKPDFSYSAHVDFEYTPAKQNLITLSLATAYRIATIEERYKYIDLGTGTPKIGNPDLKPEKGGFSNLSYIFSGRNLSIKADVFANYIFDLIAETPGKFPTLSGTEIDALISTNINKAMFVGAEMEVNWLISKSFSAFATTSYVRAEDMTTSKFLTQIPPMHGVAQLNYRLPKYFNAGLAAEWAATQNEAADTEVKTPGHVIFNFDIQSVEIKLNKTTIKVVGGVQNLLDKAYKNHLFGTRGLDYYEPGRNVFVKARLGL
jgi:hemoglobin/transferrin/lactoferrin receptor protein